MTNVIETLQNCKLELTQMHSHYQPNCKSDIPAIGCPTLQYIAACSVAIGNVQAVIDKLEAWRDNAALMVKQAHNNIQEEKWINERRNYENLIVLLKG